MKKLIALFVFALMVANSVGCSSCRNFLCGPRTSGPLLSQTQCAPACAPVCSSGMCSAGMATVGPDCGCETGTPVTYGFGGTDAGMPVSGSISYPTTPMTFPTGSGTFGQ